MDWRTCDVRTLAGTGDCVTRATGAILRDALERALEEIPEPGGILCDFVRVGVLDFSCADEGIARPVSRLASGEYGERHLILANATPTHLENLAVALERKVLACPTVLLPGAIAVGVRVKKPVWGMTGVLHPSLAEVYEMIQKDGTLTAKTLAGRLGIELNTASTRLINLHKRRLIARDESALKEGGREFVYVSLARAWAETLTQQV
ncbi:MAG: hypothetical protein HYY93_16940 [Planctomycetes bacterium]|nr:hypothetical protein [Planctomycetota bacterium]